MKIKSILTIFCTAVLFSSCFKDEDKFGWNDDPGSIVSEIFDRSYYGELKVLALNAAPASETFDIIELKMYAPRKKPGGDVQATLELVPSLVTSNGLTALPAGSYTIASLTNAIPKDGGSFKLQLTLNKSALDLSKVYGIAFRMTTVSEGIISELSKEVTVALVIKNQYHANYRVDGYFFHPSAPRLIGATKGLSTLGADRCAAQVGDLSGWVFAFDVSGANMTNYGSAAPGTPPVPPASGLMTLDNPGNVDYSVAIAQDGANPGTAPWVHSTYSNTYNAATKTFYMHYGYAGGATSEGGYTRQIYEKWVRQ